MRKVIDEIKKHSRFLITAHVNLEGDSLGSQLAMKGLLEGMGKTVFVVDSDPVPKHYKFLPKADTVSNDIDKKLEFDAAVVLDCPTLRRIGRVKELLSKNKTVINIDHHVSNEKFGAVNWVDARASSAAEMVYKLFKETGIPLTKETALCLYIAILTDTGSFNYDNTSSITHEIAGELLGYGLDPALVSESVYENRSVADIRLLAMALSSLRLNRTKEVAYMEITRKMLRATGADMAKSEGFINYARSIDKVKIAVLFKEDGPKPGKINVSFRSKGNIDVNEIASYFGGGGHIKASGCTVNGSLAAAQKKVLDRVEKALKMPSGRK